jgi:hypothetical protein
MAYLLLTMAVTDPGQWSIQKILSSGIPIIGNDSDDAHHVRHCIDYLRQSLMCAADGTLEPVDAGLGGVTGWGEKRKCGDYDALKSWAEQRRASHLKGLGIIRAIS